MRAKGKKILLLLVVLCCAAFAVYRVWSARHTDNAPPTITMAQDELRLSVYDDRARLLDGVRAEDAHDGDVTDSLVVESVSGLVSEGRFTVTYAAFDAAGNVAKAQRTVCYEDYISPRFSLTSPLIFRESTSLDVFAPLAATDVLDGSLKDRIKGTLVDGERQLTAAGDYTVAFRVTNSLGDTAYLTAPVKVIAAEQGNATLTLSTYLVYLAVGADFDPYSYLGELTAAGQTVPAYGSAEITLESNVDTAHSGVYTVDYTAEYGQYSAQTRLLVVVED